MRIFLLCLIAPALLSGCVAARVAGDIAEGAVRTTGDVIEGAVDNDENEDKGRDEDRGRDDRRH